MVTDECPDCAVLQPHFDMSPEAGNLVDGGTQPGSGFTAVTFREVSCGFTGNILCQIQTTSSPNFISLLFASS